MDPTRKICPRHIFIAHPVDADKDLLHGIFGRVAVLQRPVAEPKDLILVAVVQGSERKFISVAHAQHQLVVIKLTRLR